LIEAPPFATFTCLTRTGGAIEFPANELRDYLSGDKLLWIHLDSIQASAEEWLIKSGIVEERIAEALTSKHTRARFDHVDNDIVVILRGVNFSLESMEEEMVSVRLFATPTLVVTVTPSPILSRRLLQEIYEKKKGPKTISQFVVLFSELLLKRMEPVIRRIEERIDELEDLVFQNIGAISSTEVAEIQRKAIIFKRHFSPQSIVIEELAEAHIEWFSDEDYSELTEQEPIISRNVELLEEVRQRAELLYNQLSQHLAQKINENSYTFAAVTTIFLPAMFLSSLFGTNLNGIPGADFSMGFYYFSTFLIFLTSSIFLFLKTRKIL